MLAARRINHRTLVLGRQIASAQSNEAARLATGDVGPSPLPAGYYREEAGDYDLLRVTVLAFDRDLQTVVRSFKADTPEERSELQERISIDGEYTLIHFAKRCAVLALREHPLQWCEDGLLALAMVDETRIDPRDASWAAGLLSHAISKTGVDFHDRVKQVASMARPGMQTIIARVSESADLSDWGYSELRTTDGTLGLIRSGFASYEPTLDLTALALELAANLQRGRYIAEPELAVDVPTVWFEKARRSEAEELLEKAPAAVSVHGKLRADDAPNSSAQQFTQWVVEMPTPGDAATLAAGVGTRRLDSRFALGVSSGRLFSLIVAGSFVAGVGSFESPESVRAIAEETKELLRRSQVP